MRGSGKGNKRLLFLRDVLALGAFAAALTYGAYPEYVRWESDRVYIIRWLLLLAAGVWITPRGRFDIPTALGIVLLPLMVDQLLVCRQEFAPLILLLCLLGFLGYGTAVLAGCMGSIRAGRLKGRWKRFLRNFLHRSRRLLLVILAVSLPVSGAVAEVRTRRSREASEAAIAAARAESLLETMGNDAELILRLREDTWSALSDDDRLQTLQQITVRECEYLGIPYPLTVEVTQLDSRSAAGCYSNSSRTVRIDEDVFGTGSGEYVLSVLLHEIYHAFEYAVTDIYHSADSSYKELKFFEKASRYSEEFANYIPYLEDKDGYEGQWVEQDSDAYAEERGREYRTVLKALTAAEEN